MISEGSSKCIVEVAPRGDHDKNVDLRENPVVSGDRHADSGGVNQEHSKFVRDVVV